MKTTLTQAWEARGLSGVALRTAIGYKLTSRFYKDNPSKDKVGRRLAYEAVGSIVFAYIGFVFLYLLVPLAKTLDLSVSLQLGIFVASVAGPLILLIQAAILGYFAVKDAAFVGLVDRYIFQHRDEEVEL